MLLATLLYDGKNLMKSFTKHCRIGKEHAFKRLTLHYLGTNSYR